MNDEIQLISDGDGLAVIGDSSAVERFLAREELQSEGLDLHRITRALGAGAAAAQAGWEIAANSGAWVKLTADARAQSAVSLWHERPDLGGSSSA